MSSKIRECIDAVRKGQASKQKLSEYIKESMILHNKYARHNFIMHYYVFHEIVYEGLNARISEAQDVIDKTNEITSELFDTNADHKKIVEELSGLRHEIERRTEIISSYADKYKIYEYIFNRIQYRYEVMDEIYDDNTFTQMAVRFIFMTKDNVTINENIRSIIAQLPVRMTRKHFIELIKEHISVYRDGDLAALNRFLYLFRHSAFPGVYPDEDERFRDLKASAEVLRSLDYEHFSKEEYEKNHEILEKNMKKISDLSDIYTLLMTLINNLYIIVLSQKYAKGIDMEIANGFMRTLNEYFGKDIPREINDEINARFEKLEGKQEKSSMSIQLCEGALEEIENTYKDKISIWEMSDEFTDLEQISLLNSTSLFASLDLSDDEDSQTVTAEMLDKVTADVLAELKNIFNESSKIMRRAIMANAFYNLPVFFNSYEEVKEYIYHSLAQCNDEAEKYVSKKLILDEIMVDS